MKISIKTPARLHLGLLDLNGNLGRLYGSIGVAIGRPNTVVVAETAEELTILGKQKKIAERFVKKFSQYYNIEPKARIEIKEAIPEHVGLGSGTQLALAIGTALSKINGMENTTGDIAKATGRGSISGIGISSFEKGGFIVDSGINLSDPKPPRPLFHLPFPGEWSFVIAIPDAKKGLSGKEEASAFKKIIPASENLSKGICRTLIMKMLPALLEKDIESFGSSLTEIDKKNGEYFKGAQSGVYEENSSAEIVRFMLDSGAYGAGQSSWGPAVYGLIECKHASRLETKLIRYMRENKIKGEAFTAKPNNTGAEIKTS